MFVNLSLVEVVGQKSFHAYRTVILIIVMLFAMRQHVKSQKHIRAAEAQKGTQAISNDITKGQTEQEQVLQAELIMAMLVAKTTSRFPFVISIQPDSGAL